MGTPIAWLNLKHRKSRTLAALSGVSMAIILIFLQLGFYTAAFKSAVMILQQFDYDLALVSGDYVYIRQSGSFPKSRLDQARSVEGVAGVMPLYMGVGLTQIPGLDAKREIAILGIDPAQSLWLEDSMSRLARNLSQLDTVLLDTKVGPGYDRLRAGLVLEIDNHRVRIADTFTHGPGFTGSAALLTGDQTYARIFNMPDRDSISVGLVKTRPGTDVDAIVTKLNAVLPSDVHAFSRIDLENGEQNWSIKVKPVGIMFTSGLMLAFVVGAVILYQILATEIINHLREYATLKAMGSTSLSLNMLVWKQAILYSVLGYIPASIIASMIYMLIDGTTTLPTEMTTGKLFTVFIIVSIMCVSAGTAAARKVNKADPAELF